MLVYWVLNLNINGGCHAYYKRQKFCSSSTPIYLCEILANQTKLDLFYHLIVLFSFYILPKVQGLTFLIQSAVFKSSLISKIKYKIHFCNFRLFCSLGIGNIIIQNGEDADAVWDLKTGDFLSVFKVIWFDKHTNKFLSIQSIFVNDLNSKFKV